ncbi:MAG: GH3 family domain-containing protein, partial [Planctomycetota bacterium]
MSPRLLRRIWSRHHAVRLQRALENPAAAQERLLRRLLHRHRDTAFGRDHAFARISDWAGFRERVPVRDPSDWRPW